MTRIIFSDFREAGICPTARYWFEEHGLDWRHFVKNGIEVEDLLATNNHIPRIRQLEQIALRRENG